ncbi:sensor histidine kinase [Herbidospora galbida]|uniref:sensor histidine kinase n=1 Tax=Herbidospora galbida TaxID=2575442 RepID=UPI001BAF570F|nr:sensor histidine kinase [Herbidospora galbida]
MLVTTGRALAYTLLLPLTAGIGLVHLVVVLLSVLTTVNLVGVPMLALSLVAARGLGTVNRRLARALLGARVTDPAPFRPGKGLFRWMGAALVDATGWRAVGHALIRIPAAVLALAAAAGLWGGGLILLVSPVWRLVPDGWPSAALLAPAGLALLLLAPRGLRLALAPERLLAGTLLGMSASETRIRRLEQARAFAVDDAVARLRQVERDLHDGTSARLVTLAMSLGLAREELDLAHHPGHLERARELVGGAHRDAKETVAELRDLIRGILPPALDQGLETALATLAARTPIPVRLHTDLPERPDPSIEVVAYFCATELLANVVRHSGARHAAVDVRGRDGRLTLTVRDDGTGGAVAGAGSGLRGLAARVGAVDGAIDVRSPAGGPTVITVALPFRI